MKLNQDVETQHFFSIYSVEDFLVLRNKFVWCGHCQTFHMLYNLLVKAMMTGTIISQQHHCYDNSEHQESTSEYQLILAMSFSPASSQPFLYQSSYGLCTLDHLYADPSFLSSQ